MRYHLGVANASPVPRSKGCWTPTRRAWLKSLLGTSSSLANRGKTNLQRVRGMLKEILHQLIFLGNNLSLSLCIYIYIWYVSRYPYICNIYICIWIPATLVKMVDSPYQLVHFFNWSFQLRFTFSSDRSMGRLEVALMISRLSKIGNYHAAI